jgi:hypothetical protein
VKPIIARVVIVAALPVCAPVTVTAAVPLTPPLVARTVAAPALPAAVNKAPLVIDPAPPESTVHVNPGCVAKITPNWSYPVAENCSVVPALSEYVPGLTRIVVTVCATTTVTALLTVSVPSLIVTKNVYVPAFVNVATVVFAPLFPFVLNVAVPPVGTLLKLHTYVSPPSPPSSAPSTLSVPVVPVTVPGPLAGVATVGAPFVTVTVAVPLIPPTVAEIVAPPAVVPAANTPPALTLPTPDTLLHTNAGCTLSATPNWSYPTAESPFVPFTPTVDVPGVTPMLASVDTTLNVTALVTVSDPSLIVTWNV